MIDARSIAFSYPKRPDVLADVSVHVDGGEVIGLSGVSGSGKSTLLFVFGLLLRPGDGILQIDGVDVSDASDQRRSELRRDVIGFLFQDAVLDPTRTVLDNVTEVGVYGGLGRPTLVDRARELLVRYRLDIPADRRPGEVSGGQAQRIALCRALVHRPRLVLADEPTASLDADNAAGVLDGLVSVARGDGAAVVIASHDAGVLARCDRVVTL